jgi:hypothetical protein
VWKHDARRAECFHTISRNVFTQFRECFHTIPKNVLYLFYNIAQRKKFSDVSVLTLSYINTALSQSAFIIYKCYIINIYLYVIYGAICSIKTLAILVSR